MRDGLAALALLLALLNVAGAEWNRIEQAKDAEAQASLARAQTFANLDNGLIQLLARTSAEKNDPALRDVLARNGVTFKLDAESASPPVATGK